MTLTKKIYLFFWLALLLHLLLFLSFSLKLSNWTNDLPTEEKILPAYIYREEKNSPAPSPHLLANETHKNIETSKDGIKKSILAKPTMNQPTSEHYSVGKGEQNINLQLKANNKIDKPLLDILSKATAAHLVYPKIAVDFHTRGTVMIGFIISPEGQVSNVTLLHSSGSTILDEAGLSAIRAISPVKKVNAYIAEPKTLVVGISFV